jgi:hypothetical protein
MVRELADEGGLTSRLEVNMYDNIDDWWVAVYREIA